MGRRTESSQTPPAAQPTEGAPSPKAGGGAPNKVVSRSPDWGSTYSVWVVDTDYKEFALLYSEGAKGPGQDFRMATLYSRSQTPGAELKQKFMAFCKAQGFTEDIVVFLPRNDKCMEEQD